MNALAATSRYDAFLAVREAAARRMEATAANGGGRNPPLTRTLPTMDHGVATQAPLSPMKGQRIDFLA
ncbi:MAG: hypothetical protein H6686_10720 [Fibrobacteria bacterium]|nr:hypothetical protein [Fibrobacteria bacterium]